MTTPRTTLSSTRILRTTLIWSAVVTAVLAVAGGIAGWFAGGVDGVWSALCGVLIAAIFLAITSISILVANR